MKLKTVVRFIPILLFALIIGLSPKAVAFAENTDYIYFNSMERMDADGSFTFGFDYNVTSDKFTATSSNCKITIRAELYNGKYSSSNTDIVTSWATASEKQYKIEIFKDSAIGMTSISSQTLYAGTSYNISFNTEIGAKYHFELTDTSTGSYYFHGTGKVTF